MANTGSIITQFGGAVSDLFGGIGELQAEGAYKKEEQIALENAQISEASTAIQEAQTVRRITQAYGAERASTAGSGFTMGGNASDLMRQSIEQGALAKNLVNEQGQLITQGYEEQAAAAQGQAAAATTGGAGGIIGGILKGVGALFGF